MHLHAFRKCTENAQLFLVSHSAFFLTFAAENKIITMKRTLLTLALVALTNLCFSQGKEVSLVDKKGHCGQHNSGIPIVSSDGDDVTIKSDSTITDMTVVIRDQYGNVMHQSTQTVGPAETTLYVPNTDGDSEKTTIDLYYDRRHLSGTFEE